MEGQYHPNLETKNVKLLWAVKRNFVYLQAKIKFMKYFLLVGMSCASLAFSQTKGSVGINTNTPKSTLDVNAKDKNSTTEIVGLQIPRTTRAEITAKNSLYGNNQIGAMIYVTDISGGDADESSPRKYMTKTGVYQLTNTTKGLKWWRIFAIDEAEYMYKDDGTLTGNRTVTQGDKTLTFTGTATGGSIFHNTSGKATKPIAALQIIDGAQGEGKILTSDKDGNATWKKASATAITGTFTADGIPSITTVASHNTGATITLPPGKWAVSLGMQLDAVPASDNSIGGYWNVAYLYPSSDNTKPDLPNLPYGTASSNTKFLTAGYIDSQLGTQTLFGSYILTVKGHDPVTFNLFFYPSSARGGAAAFPTTARYENIAKANADNTYLYAIKLND